MGQIRRGSLDFGTGGTVTAGRTPGVTTLISALRKEICRVVSDLYQLQGSLRGKPGVFEWIVDQRQVTHRRFIPGGTTTGFPNQIPGGK